jgi:cobalt-zinc-cadmium efflux system outer membrane protein
MAHSPALQEATAEIEAARGRWTQAGKYPNPRFAYREGVLGTQQNPVGDLSLEATQQIVTGGKRRLDIAITAAEVDIATLAYEGRKFEVLTRVRRAYHEYLGWAYTERVSAATVAALEQGVEITRRQVEDAKIRPRTDLVRLRAVLEEGRLARGRARTSMGASWRQVAAEVGVADLAMPKTAAELPVRPARWDFGEVRRRVLAANSQLRQAAAETQRARFEVDRARAEVVPNVIVGAGYSANYPENQHGALLSVEAPLPLWDRNQGRIREAQARWAKAQAAERTAADRLLRDTAEAFGRYESSSQQVERLSNTILPALQESVELIRRGYQTGAAQLTFADVLLAEQNLGEARLRLAEAQRELGRASADLMGLMQLDLGEELK